MVQQSRSLLIHHLLHNGFKEEDEEDDEDEPRQLNKCQPSDIKGKNDYHSNPTEFKHNPFESVRFNHDIMNSHAQEKKFLEDFDCNEENTQHLLPSEPLKNIKFEFQNSKGGYLQQKEKISKEEKNEVHGNKHGLKERRDSFSHDYATNFINRISRKDDVVIIRENQQIHECGIGEQKTLNPPSIQIDSSQALPNEENPTSFEETSDTKIFVEEMIANTSISNTSNLDFGKKLPILKSMCTESLTIDQGSSTDSVNGSDKVLQDVILDTTSKYDRNFIDKFNVHKESHLDLLQSTENKNKIFMLQHAEISAKQFDKNYESKHYDRIDDCQIEENIIHNQDKNNSPQLHNFEENHVQNYFICNNALHNKVLNQNMMKSSKFDFFETKNIDKNSTLLCSSSNIPIRECPSNAHSCLKLLNPQKPSNVFVHLNINERKEGVENFKTIPTKNVEDNVLTTLHGFGVKESALQLTSVVHVEITKHGDETNNVKIDKDIVDVNTDLYVEKRDHQQDTLHASDNLIYNVKETQLAKLVLKTHKDAIAFKEINGENETFEREHHLYNIFEDKNSLKNHIDSKTNKTCNLSPTISTKNQFSDIVQLNIVCPNCDESNTNNQVSWDKKLKGPIIQSSEILPNKNSIHNFQFLANAPTQDIIPNTQNSSHLKPILQVDTKDFTSLNPKIMSPNNSSNFDHSAFVTKNISFEENKTENDGSCSNHLSTQMLETSIAIASPQNSHDTTSPLTTTSAKASPNSMNVVAPKSTKKKLKRPSASSTPNPTIFEKATTSRPTTKKRKTHVHHNAKTMVLVRSNTRVAYGPHFINQDLPLLRQENIQDSVVANTIKPSLYEFANTNQSTQALMRLETDKQLMQAQTSAQDAMVAATSALTQSHYEWSRMQSQIGYSINGQTTLSHMNVMREGQIASIAASITAAAVVAKAAVEATRAIQEASNQAIKEFGALLQSHFVQSDFTKTFEFSNSTKINNSGLRKTNKRKIPSTSKNELLKDEFEIKDASTSKKNNHCGKSSCSEENTNEKIGTVVNMTHGFKIKNEQNEPQRMESKKTNMSLKNEVILDDRQGDDRKVVVFKDAKDEECNKRAKMLHGIKICHQENKFAPYGLVELKDSGSDKFLLPKQPQIELSDVLIHTHQTQDKVINCNKDAINTIEPNEIVEVMTEEVGLQGIWFIAKVLMKMDREALVQYDDHLKDDGCTPYRDLFPLFSVREESAYGKLQHNNQRWLRPIHPFNKTWKRCHDSMLPQLWTVGDHVDAFSNCGWCEGIIEEINKVDNTNIKIRFPVKVLKLDAWPMDTIDQVAPHVSRKHSPYKLGGEKNIKVIKSWDVRPSLIWTGDDWRPWKENSSKHDEPSIKPQKLNKINEKIKIEEKNKKYASLKKLPMAENCKQVFNNLRPQLSRQSMEIQKNTSAMNKVLYTRKIDSTPTRSMNNRMCKKSFLKRSLRNQVHSARRRDNATTCKKSGSKIPSSTSSGPTKRTISTRLKLKLEAEEQKKLKNLVASKVIQKGAKTISTRSDTLKLKSKSIQTKFLKALKKTSHYKIPPSTQKKS